MTARGLENIAYRLIGKIATSGSFIYGIEPSPHQPLLSEYLDCEDSARKQSTIGFYSMALDPEGHMSERYRRRYTDMKESVGATSQGARHFDSGTDLGLTTIPVFSCRNEMAEYGYTGARMNVSLAPVFRKWIATVEVVS